MNRMLIDESGLILCGRLTEADGFYTRTMGLMGKEELEEGEGLFLRKVGSIHTCFMKFPIDVIYLDSQLRVLDKETVKPWKMGKLVKGAVHVLELKERRGELFYAGQQLIVLDEQKKGREAVMGQNGELEMQMNNLEEIKKRYENNELDQQIKGCLVGGFDKKSVKAALESYREILRWMEGTFHSQLEEVTSEKEKSNSECTVLKLQLKDAKEKILEADELQAQCDSLNDALEGKEARIGQLEEALSEALAGEENLKKEIPGLQEEKRILEEQLQNLKEEYEQLASIKGVAGQDFELKKDTVKDLTRQLESMTFYCETLEQQQAALERQLESMKTISKEFEAITKESDICKEELRGYQKKFFTMKRENDELYGELESASRLLTNVLEQYEKKEQENGILKKELSEQKQQVVNSMKDKLDLQNANVTLMEDMISLEHKMQIHEKENQLLKKNLKTLKEELRKMENGKVINMSAPDEEEHEEDLSRTLELARSASERLSDMVATNGENASETVVKVV